MLFLYSSKRRHVEFLLNCSANRWRFSCCLYEIKWNIPIKKKTSPSVPSLFTVSLSVCRALLALSLHLIIFWLASGMGKGTLLLKVKWKVDRFVLPITTSPGNQASTKHLPEFSANQQTGLVSPTLEAKGASSCFSSPVWTCLTLTQVGLCQVPTPPHWLLTGVWQNRFTG